MTAGPDIPRVARWLLATAAPAVDRHDVLADAAAGAREIFRARGAAHARRWYWRQVRTSLAPLLLRRCSIVTGLISGALSMSDLRADLLFALRRIIRRPAVPLVVTLTMALGIAAVTAVFSVADAILLRPIPLPDSGRILRLYTSMPSGQGARGGPFASVNLLDFNDLSASAATLAAAAPYTTTSYVWRSEAGPDPVAAARVGERYADVLGLRVQQGRWFAPGEFTLGADTVAVITDGFWRRAFGARPDAIGQVLDLDGRRFQVVGVLPPSDFLFPAAADIWTPLAIQRFSYLDNRQSVQLGAIARVRPGRRVSEALAEIAAIDARLGQAYPITSGQRHLSARVMADTLAAPVRPTLLLLVAAVAAVLVIAAANIADLLLTDASARQHEFAVRGALGAGTARLARQVASETLLLVLGGAAIGLTLAPALTTALVSRYPVPLPRVAEIGLNARALLIALAATGIAGLLVAVPLIRASRRPSLETDLRAAGRGGSGRRTRRLASALVIAQVALSVTVLSGGVVLLKTFVDTARSTLGFDPGGTLTFGIDASGPRYQNYGAVAGFYDDLTGRIRQLPGVTAVGLTQFLPFVPGMWGDSFARVGTSDAPPNLPEANVHFISPQLPEALGQAVVEGRAFDTQDIAGRPAVAMVNLTLARAAFGGHPLGRHIVWQSQDLEIVGVLGDKRHASLVEPPAPELYLPWAQQRRIGGWMVVRATDPASLAPLIKARLKEIDPTIPMTRVATMDARMRAVVAPERFRATLAGALGIAAVGLAVLGLYGILAHRVREQRREIAIRLALGEPAARVRRSVVIGALKLCAAGVVVGIAGAMWSSRFIQDFMTTGAPARDPIAITSVSVALLVVGALAAWLPARRASRTSPLDALRQD